MGSRVPLGHQYRARARECTEAADRANDAGRRLSLVELAERWLMLADQVDRISSERSVAGDLLLDFVRRV